MTKIIAYGGSFNPVHIGHVITVFYASQMVEHDRIVVIPTYLHPDGKQLAPFEHRFKMCELAFADIPNLEVSPIEQELGGLSYTLRTVKALMQSNPDWEINLLMGSDVARVFPTWSDYPELSQLVDIFPVGRMGFTDGLDRIVPEVSSSIIRADIASGDFHMIGHLLPPAVMNYILEHDLFGYKR